MRSASHDETVLVRDGFGRRVLLREVEISRSCTRRAGLAQIALRGVAHVSTFAPAQWPEDRGIGEHNQIDCSGGAFVYLPDLNLTLLELTGRPAARSWARMSSRSIVNAARPRHHREQRELRPGVRVKAERLPIG
jgi:hypothetical protein